MAQSGQQYELNNVDTDGITSMRLIDNKQLLVSSWDKKVRLYDISAGTLTNSYTHKAAVLDCCYVDRNRSLSGGLDKSIILHDFNSNTNQIVGTHDGTVRCLDFDAGSNSVISGSWDSTVRTWDYRSNNSCTGTYKQHGKVFSMSRVGDKLVVATNGRNVAIYDLRNMASPLQSRESPLKYQTRCVKIYPNGTGYAISSIEGRVAMEYFDDAPEVQARKYAFKCHRANINGVDTAYPVNALSFHRGYGTFATGGCDGVVSIWDGENKKRLANFSKYPTSIAALEFSEDGNTLVIASSYTFEEGEKDHAADQIFIRTINDVEVRPKQRAPA